MRWLAALLCLMVLPPVARADLVDYPAPDGQARDVLTVYSTLDSPLAAPLIAAFQARNPGVAIRYEDLLASEIARRVIAETDVGRPTADLVFSSGMDLQLKLANDGYAQPVAVAPAADWPDWAQWQDTAFALTVEPAVLVYHIPSFPDGPPQSRLDLMDWLDGPGRAGPGRIATYDIERSSVGYLFLARDAEHFRDVWPMLEKMAAAGLQTFATSQEIIDRVADGRLAIGYNILGSYAADRALTAPDLGLVLLRDFTVVVSRVALVPRGAARPDLGAAFLEFLMQEEGQTLLADRLRLPSVGLQVLAGSGGLAALGDQMRPVAVSPGVLVYLDQSKRRRLLRQWHQALAGD